MLDKLEFIIALARERHFGHAAEACGVSQPTFSAGIKQLEDMLGVLLVQRGSRFQGFTPEGERVLDWARRIVGDTRAMRQEVDALKHGLAGHIRIAAIPTALAMVAMITTPYRAKHPDVSFTILSRNSIEGLGLLENLEVDAPHLSRQRAPGPSRPFRSIASNTAFSPPRTARSGTATR
jgi:DNA-binding transcriptional LysR family regulator